LSYITNKGLCHSIVCFNIYCDRYIINIAFSGHLETVIAENRPSPRSARVPWVDILWSYLISPWTNPRNEENTEEVAHPTNSRFPSRYSLVRYLDNFMDYVDETVSFVYTRTTGWFDFQFTWINSYTSHIIITVFMATITVCSVLYYFLIHASKTSSEVEVGDSQDRSPASHQLQTISKHQATRTRLDLWRFVFAACCFSSYN